MENSLVVLHLLCPHRKYTKNLIAISKVWKSFLKSFVQYATKTEEIRVSMEDINQSLAVRKSSNVHPLIEGVLNKNLY